MPQLLDIPIHAATHQLEPLRVSSNLVILLWRAAGTSGRLNSKHQLMAVVSSATYLVLNLVFLIQAGVSNPGQDGSFHIDLHHDHTLGLVHRPAKREKNGIISISRGLECVCV